MSDPAAQSPDCPQGPRLAAAGVRSYFVLVERRENRRIAMQQAPERDEDPGETARIEQAAWIAAMIEAERERALDAWLAREAEIRAGF
jgi:hypothetical protein